MTYLSGSKASAKTERQIGFIAQDVEVLFPELVYNDKDNDFLGLHYSWFVPLLVEVSSNSPKKCVSSRAEQTMSSSNQG
jgi:hypothetical protein